MERKIDVASLGKKLEQLRLSKPWTLRQAALHVGISHSQIRFIETGITLNPSLDTLKKLAAAYDVPMTDLLSEEELNLIKEAQADYGANSSLDGIEVMLLRIKDLSPDDYESITAEIKRRKALLEQLNKEQQKNARLRRLPNPDKTESADKESETPPG